MIPTSTPSVAATRTPTGAQGTGVYFQDFEGTVGAEWQDATTNVTRNGNRRFLAGRFVAGAYSNTLALEGLPVYSRGWQGDVGCARCGGKLVLRNFRNQRPAEPPRWLKDMVLSVPG